MDTATRCAPVAAASRSETPAGPYAAYRATRFFASLDGLRALSIVAVIWHHTGSTGATLALLREGRKGVDLFFVISGLLIVTLLLRAKERHGTFSLPKFWARRALRIFPVYYVVLALYVGIVIWLERDPVARQTFFANLPAYATFTSNWFVDLTGLRVIFYFAWSLAAEEQFYLVWPWFERWLHGAAPLLAALAVLALTQGAGIATATLPPQELALGLRIVTSVPAAILLGVILAHLLHAPRTFRALHFIAGRRGSALAALVLVLASLGAVPALGAFASLVTAAAMALLVAACVMREDNDLARFLTTPAVAWIGKVSYGMYLLHMLAANIVHRLTAAVGVDWPWLDFGGSVAAAVGLASVSYVFFESRVLRAKDRWFAENRGRTAVLSD